jgi:hypothetical protein
MTRAWRGRGYGRPLGRPRVSLLPDLATRSLIEAHSKSSGRVAQDRRTQRRRVQARFGFKPLRVPGKRRKRLRCAWLAHLLRCRSASAFAQGLWRDKPLSPHPFGTGPRFHGLVTLIHEMSGLVLCH